MQQRSTNNDPSIEALRGFAALMVVATHYAHFLTPTPGGWAFASSGVNLFFVLSGFVFGPYLFNIGLHFWPHMVRRFFRMYPLYLCALLVYVAIKSWQGDAWAHFGAHLLMAQTLHTREIAFYYNAAFWSLPPEVEFYILLPVLAWLVRKAGLFPLLCLAAALHFGLMYAQDLSSTAADIAARATVHFPGLLIEFLLGSAAYALTQRLDAWVRPCAAVLSIIFLLSAYWVFRRYLAVDTPPQQEIPRWVSSNMGLFWASGYSLLVVAIVTPKAHSPLQLSAFWGATCTWAGNLSYGLYLFHNAAPPILARFLPGTTGVTLVVLCLTLTVSVAWLTHVLIEAPCRIWGRQLSRKMDLLKKKQHP